MKTVTVHLTDEAYAALEAASWAEALSRTDVINRALLVYSALSSVHESKRVTIRECDGSPWRIAVVEAAS